MRGSVRDSERECEGVGVGVEEGVGVGVEEGV